MKAKSISIMIITIFTISLFLCMAVLGIWIYWYLTSSSYFITIAGFIRPEPAPRNYGTVFFIAGITALTLIITGIILIFSRLIRQTEKNKIYNDFMNTVSHELKTPLASIQLSLDTVRQRKISGEQREIFYRIMATDTERLSGLIENIFETALLDDDKKIFSGEYMVADETISRIAKELISQRIDRIPELTITGEAPCIIYFEQKSMYIILSNLIENAIKFNTGNAGIKIRYEIRGGRFIMDFSDNGIGIPKLDRKRAFEKFSRLNPGKLTEVKGTGLGLYSVKKIIRHFNGSIRIIDSENGTGCRFRIKLPVAEQKNDR